MIFPFLPRLFSFFLSFFFFFFFFFFFSFLFGRPGNWTEHIEKEAPAHILTLARTVSLGLPDLSEAQRATSSWMYAGGLSERQEFELHNVLLDGGQHKHDYCRHRCVAAAT